MAKRVQLRRGNAVEHSTFVGAVGELTVSTDTKELRVHDGETQGGVILAKASDIDSLASTDVATTTTNGLMSSEDKISLDDYVTRGITSTNIINGTRIIKNSNGVLECDDHPIREFGVYMHPDNSLAGYVRNDSLAWMEEIDKIAESGIRFVKVDSGIRHQIDFNTYWFPDGGTEVLRKTKQFIQYSQNKGVGVALRMFDYWHTIADMGEQTIEDAYGNTSSTSFDLLEDMIEAYCNSIGDMQGLAAWVVGNNFLEDAEAGSLPVINASVSTRALALDPEDKFSISHMRNFYTKFAEFVNTNDTTNRIIISGDINNESESIEELRSSLGTSNASFDTISIGRLNNYKNLTLRNNDDLKDFIIDLKNKAESLNKGFVLNAIGTVRNEIYGSYGGTTGTTDYTDNLAVFKNGLQQIYASGCQLSFVYTWNKTLSTNTFDDFSLHPDNTTNGTDEKYQALRFINNRMIQEKFVETNDITKIPVTVSPGQFISPVQNQSALVTVPHSATMLSYTGFAVSFWIRNALDNQINKNIINKVDFNEGWSIRLGNSGEPTMLVNWDDATSTNVNGQLSALSIARGWNHYVFQLQYAGSGIQDDRESQGLTVYQNGRIVGYSAIPNGKTWTPSNSSLGIFDIASGPSSEYSFFDLKDLRLFDRALTDKEIHTLYYHEIIPTDTQIAHWKFNGNFNDSGGNGLNAVISAGSATFTEY